jgi:hypothetical protein
MSGVVQYLVFALDFRVRISAKNASDITTYRCEPWALVAKSSYNVLGLASVRLEDTMGTMRMQPQPERELSAEKRSNGGKPSREPRNRHWKLGG